jgi:hypothetical protein
VCKPSQRKEACEHYRVVLGSECFAVRGIFFACGRLLYLVVRTKQNWPSQREATPDRFLGGSSFAGTLAA